MNDIICLSSTHSPSERLIQFSRNAIAGEKKQCLCAHLKTGVASIRSRVSPPYARVTPRVSGFHVRGARAGGRARRITKISIWPDVGKDIRATFGLPFCGRAREEASQPPIICIFAFSAASNGRPSRALFVLGQSGISAKKSEQRDSFAGSPTVTPAHEMGECLSAPRYCAIDAPRIKLGLIARERMPSLMHSPLVRKCSTGKRVMLF